MSQYIKAMFNQIKPKPLPYKEAQIEWIKEKNEIIKSKGGYRHKGNTKKQKRPNKKRSNKKRSNKKY
uniref:Uncharacterized protein n=1 Tax=viral metagenome TaxID=1070528 RepID=A0A6C0ES90_9ZZZZ